MITAAFDTSTNEASFILLDGNEVVLSVSKECHRGASKLLPWISEIIKKEGYNIADVNRWLVGKGPGSFTGLRVGLSFVKGVCFGKPSLYSGVNSGYAYLPYADQEAAEELTVLHDGRKKEVISNRFIKTKGAWQEAGVEVLRIEDLRKSLFDGPLLTQMDVSLFPKEIEEDIVQVGPLKAQEFLSSGVIFSKDEKEMNASCEPIYVRPPVFVQPACKK